MIDWTELIMGQKYLLLDTHGFNIKRIPTIFVGIEGSDYDVNRAIFKHVETGLKYVVPFLELVPAIPVSSLEIELW